MPKTRVNDDASEFSARLLALLKSQGLKRHGAGAYLAKKYDVSNNVANAWLNGTHKPGLPIAERIATDHGSTLDALYFGKPRPSTTSTPFPFSPEEWNLIDEKIRDALVVQIRSLISIAKESASRGRRQSPVKSGGI